MDDNDSFRAALLRHFRPHRNEWEVVAAPDGAEAMKIADAEPIDLLITDILMPVRDGIETIAAFRRGHPSVKIIAMSGGGRWVGLEPLLSSRVLGAHRILEKPFEFAHLRDAITGLLRESPLHREEQGVE